MTFDKWAGLEWLPFGDTIGKAVDYLSDKSGESQDGLNPNRIRMADLYLFARQKQLPLVVKVPPGTKDGEGRPIEEGLWDLPMEGAAKQQVEYDYHVRANLPSINMDGITGAWVERKGDRRQLAPKRRTRSAFSEGCVLAVRREALDALLAAKMPTPSAPDSADALDRPLKTLERTTLLTIIAVLAKEAKINLSKTSKAAGMSQ